MPKELHLYDFDGTLFKAPDRPSWWGKTTWIMDSVSLGPPCVPLKPGNEWWVSKAVADAKRSIGDPNVLAILCTGRALGSSHRYRVPELLKQKGLHFDEVYLNPGEDTKNYKIKVILRLARRHGIGVVHIWENHLSNMAAFCKAVRDEGLTCVQHPITVKSPDPICTEQELKDLMDEGWAKQRVASARRVANRYLDQGADYLSAKLSPMSRVRLLKAFPALHDDIRADHMTIWYDPPQRVLDRLQPLVGRKVQLKVVGQADDDKGQAVVISTRLPTKRRHPHITISVSPGTKAVYSNDLLARGYSKVVGPTLDAVLVIDK